jgi:membrane-associated phospholipid phosphatase
LLRETGSDFVNLPKRRSTWVFLAGGAAAAAALHPLDQGTNKHLLTNDPIGKIWEPGKIIGASYTEIGVATGLYLAGRFVLPRGNGSPKTNKMSHLGFDLVRAQIVSQTIVQGIKYSVRRDRPTGECCAFPSGHAAAAFATATVIERHFGYRSAWPTILAAAYVATSRLHDNRHYLSDVVFGSAVGLATGWTVVGRHGRSNFTMTPVPVSGGFALSVDYSPARWHPR